jgi:transmembrane sensor
MDYTHFTIKDFVRDAYFQQWALTSDKEAGQFWQRWLQQHPHKAEEVTKAREMIQLLRFQQNYHANEDFLDVWETVQQQINNMSSPTISKTAFLKPLTRAALTRVAAVFIAVLLPAVMVLLLWKPDTTITYSTQFGETRSLTLPDGSEVTLNANSSIRFSETWNQFSPREVWLDGEAFFEVEKVFTKTSQTAHPAPIKFIVHTRSLEVEVLGTEFNVNNRREETKVVLKSGKVKLNVKDGEKVEEIFMEPGEMVAFNEMSKVLTKEVVNPDIHASWKNHQLIFEEAMLGDIACILEDDYGVVVKFEDPLLAHEQFTGLVPSDDINMLLEAFTKLYGIQITKEQNIITFHTQ